VVCDRTGQPDYCRIKFTYESELAISTGHFCEQLKIMIKVQNLAKVFGTKRAVNDVSFSIERGEVLGFLGPNGAGKSTTMRMITGFIAAVRRQGHRRRL
jgi:ABC-type uncharacterized transport system ATPase subunit